MPPKSESNWFQIFTVIYIPKASGQLSNQKMHKYNLLNFIILVTSYQGLQLQFALTTLPLYSLLKNTNKKFSKKTSLKTIVFSNRVINKLMAWVLMVCIWKNVSYFRDTFLKFWAIVSDSKCAITLCDRTLDKSTMLSRKLLID